MGFPILVDAVIRRIPKVVLQTPFARAIHRKGGARTSVVEAGAAGTLPIPILSLEGSKRGCSVELQSLISAFRADGQEAEDALMNYIEAQLGQSIQEAYPAEWAAAKAGDPQTITIDLGTDVLTLTLTQCLTSEGDPPEEGSCEAFLVGFIDAEDWAGLKTFIEDQTGQTISELTPIWDMVELDGVTRTDTITVCGVEVEITISGTFNPVTTCAGLPTAILPLDQYDFPIVTRTIGTVPPPPGSPSALIGRWFFTQYPDGAFHITAEPEIVWLASTTDAAIRNRMFGSGGSSNVIVGGVSYRSTICIKWTYTLKIGVRQANTYSDGRLINTTFRYTHYPPPVGINAPFRFAPGEGTPDIDAPLTITDYNTASSSASTSAGFEPWAPWIFPARSTGSTVVAYQFEASSWAGCVSRVANYNANRTIYDPTMTLNDATQEITLAATTRENALYIPSIGCVPSPPSVRNRYQKLTIDYGGWYNNRSNASSSAALYCDDTPDEINSWLLGIYNRVLAGDPFCGFAYSEWRRVLPVIAGTYSPFLTGAAEIPTTACPADARCITAGPP